SRFGRRARRKTRRHHPRPACAHGRERRRVPTGVRARHSDHPPRVHRSRPLPDPAFDYEMRGAYTNTTPVDAYRGAGRPEAALLIERIMDRLADEIGMDPAEVRRKNFIPSDAFPFNTISGITYDSGDYAPALDRALA